MKTFLKGIVMVGLTLTSGAVFAEVVDIPPRVYDSIDRYFNEGHSPSFNYRGSNEAANMIIPKDSQLQLTFISANRRVTDFGYAPIAANGLPDHGQKVSLFGNLASAVPGQTATIDASALPSANSRIGFWIEQSNNPGFTNWTVDAANITRTQQAVVTPTEEGQPAIIGFEDKWIGSFPGTEGMWGSDADFNDFLVTASVVPAGEAPHGQPAPSVLYTLAIGIFTMGAIGWRRILRPQVEA